MDFIGIRHKLGGWFKKYRYVAIVLIAGVVLMLWPTTSNKEGNISETETTEHQQQDTTTEMLEDILSQIKGAGKVEVLLTCSAGERIVYHVNEKSASTEDSQSKDLETALVTDGNRKEEALVSQVLPPEYLGAVVVCQGAGDPSVRLAISEAVSKATGLGADRISVLIMK